MASQNRNGERLAKKREGGDKVGHVKAPASAYLPSAGGMEKEKETMVHALGKSITIAKEYIGGHIKKIGEVEIASILPRPERIPTLIIGKKGSGDPWPHVSNLISATHGALCPKKTISGSSPPREDSQTKIFCTLGRNGDQGTLLGAKVPDETLLRKGSKLAKVREESPRIYLINYTKGIYNMILGRYLSTELGSYLKFYKRFIEVGYGNLKGSTSIIIDLGT